VAEGHGYPLVRVKESCVLGGEGGRGGGEGEVLSMSGVNCFFVAEGTGLLGTDNNEQREPRGVME